MEMNTRGMQSEVAIRVDVRGGRSRLVSSYFTPPFKVADTTEDRRAALLHLMLMCSSPGVLDGDDLTIRVEVGEHGQVWLHTQSYQRLFRMRQGAVQRVEVRMEKGACLCWLPHPCVPHENAIFTGINQIFLSKDCKFVWGEVLTCGRKLNGEVFNFSKYHMRTEVFVDGELALLENVCLRPSVLSVGMPGQMEGFTHQASLLVMGKGAGERKREIDAYLSERCLEILFGVSEGPAGSLVVRILGNKAEPLYDCLKGIAGMLMSAKSVMYDS